MMSKDGSNRIHKIHSILKSKEDFQIEEEKSEDPSIILSIHNGKTINHTIEE
jgi:hypothetical protein